MNREAWLQAAVEGVNEILKDQADIEVPEVRVSVGWPSRGGTSLKRRRVGECWKPHTAGDGVSQIYISPVLEDPVDILGTLTHELIHAWDRGESGHRGAFVKVAKAVGLTGPWTGTSVGPDLKPMLENLAEDIGKYPHVKLTPTIKEKVQTTRMVKLECGICGYIVRTTRKWIDMGLPLCPEGDEMEEATT